MDRRINVDEHQKKKNEELMARRREMNLRRSLPNFDEHQRKKRAEQMARLKEIYERVSLMSTVPDEEKMKNLPAALVPLVVELRQKLQAQLETANLGYHRVVSQAPGQYRLEYFDAPMDGNAFSEDGEAKEAFSEDDKAKEA